MGLLKSENCSVIYNSFLYELYFFFVGNRTELLTCVHVQEQLGETIMKNKIYLFIFVHIQNCMYQLFIAV